MNTRLTTNDHFLWAIVDAKLQLLKLELSYRNNKENQDNKLLLREIREEIDQIRREYEPRRGEIYQFGRQINSLKLGHRVIRDRIKRQEINE